MTSNIAPHRSYKKPRATNPLALAYADSTILSDLKSCFYRTYLKWGICLTSHQTFSPLIFGKALHTATAIYEISGGRDNHEAAVENAVIAALKDQPSPSWWPDDKKRNSYFLLRTITNLLDNLYKYPYTVKRYNNGEPMVEVPFSFDYEGITYFGHLDRVVTHKENGLDYVIDFKHTTSSVPEHSPLGRFAPGPQFTLYTIGLEVAFGGEPDGLVIFLIEIQMNSEKIWETPPLNYSNRYKEKWLHDTNTAIFNYNAIAEQASRLLDAGWPADDLFPMNDTACFLCPFREGCRLSTPERIRYFKNHFTLNDWDPLLRTRRIDEEAEEEGSSQ